MHAQIQNICQRGGEGGEGQAQRRENSHNFFYVFFLVFFLGPKFSGDAGGPTIYGGGGPNANFYRI